MSSIDFFINTLATLLSNTIIMAPFWLTLGLGYVLWKVWMYYIRAKYIGDQEYVLLEIKLPQEILKSPLAMEVVLNALHQTSGESTWYKRWFFGKMRASFSLELVSLEGKVKFFIRTSSSLRSIIESQIYSQYPNTEIYEVPDYIDSLPYGRDGSDLTMWGTEFELSKSDPYPIKTYIDYGLDKSVREETEKVDPMTPMLEFFGGVGKGEYVLFQILIRANKGADDKTSYWNRDWEKEGKDIIDKIMGKYKFKKEGDTEESFGSLMSPGDKLIIDSIQRSLEKLAFDCGIRSIYIAHKENYKGHNVPGLIGTVKQYSSPHLNGLRVSNPTETNYPWQDYKGIRETRMKVKMFDAYRRRSWFFPPYERKPFILTSEELATIYHFPGGVAETPTFGRIESKRAEPPINLPI